MKSEKTTAALSSALSKLNRLTNERKRHEQMAADLEAEEANLIKTASLDDPKDFQKISHVRLRRDILPAKIAEFQTAGAEAEEALAAESAALVGFLIADCKARTDALVGDIAAQLKPFFTETSGLAGADKTVFEAGPFSVWDIRRAAQEIAHHSVGGAFFFETLHLLHNSNFRDLAVVRKAQQLIEISQSLDALRA
jgi:hypothetical protein